MSLSLVLLPVLRIHNPIGYGASDLIELACATALVLLALTWRPWLQPWIERLAARTAWCMLLLAILPVALRLALLSHHPVPAPDLYDEFSHLLVADTLLHGRLANPPHPLHPFFETFFILQEPTYSSIYPIGQGAMLALGRVLFGHPWAGVLLSVAALCALCYWMLLGWTTPGWALLGGLLAVVEFGPLSYWTNTYWGGAVAAAGGCLVFGALPRLRATGRVRDAALLGLGLGIHWLSRPYETIFLLLSVPLFFLPFLRDRTRYAALARSAAIALLATLPAIGITLLHDKRVTNSWTTLPEMLSQYQYGVPSALSFQPNPVPHRELTPQQDKDYRMQVSFRGPRKDTIRTFLERLEYRVRFYRFFYAAPLYAALPFFFAALGEYRLVWAALTLGLFAFGINFFPAYQHHYLAAVACLFLLVSVTALRRLGEIRINGWPAGEEAARVIVLFCLAGFGVWYGLHVFDTRDASLAVRPYETWDALNHQNPKRRIDINRQLAPLPGKQLVFVHYEPRHIFQDEWVYNAADIDNARVVWARDLGPAEDEKLRRYYPDRTVWLLEPDLVPPRLSPYQPEPEKPPAPSNQNPFLPIPTAR